jgi:aspartate-semialdehyde dehydrogenase
MSYQLRALKVGVVGATGMVGKSFMETMEQRQFPVSELRPFASDASLGKKIKLQGKEWACQVLKPGCFDGLDLVFFSSGDDISAEWGLQAVKAGAWAVDNSNAFRMNPETLLIVPEVNGHLLKGQTKPQLIANPNCTTMQLVVALKPLQQFGLEFVRVSSYQAVSGAGQPGHDELMEQFQNYGKTEPVPKAFSAPIMFNCVPEIGSFKDNGFTSEEIKVMSETPKIMGQADLKVSAFTVRVPVPNAHAETVWVKLKKDVTREQVIKAMTEGEGLVVETDAQKYHTQRFVSGKDPVYVSRIHKDVAEDRTWMMWVVSDNIRKGAALNGIQIAEQIFK